MNIKMLSKTLFSLFFVLSFMACSEVNSQDNQVEAPDRVAFNDYWYAGEAELNRYELQQARYGEIHPGDAVLIFVTEDFLTEKQVKYEGRASGEPIESILKLNFTRKFNTGLYPYSMMASVFTPVNHRKPTYKVTSSTQEWCGHTFSQLNYRKKHYEGLLHSYFEQESDQSFSLDDVLLEDEVWTQIRLYPERLPTGQIEIIPGAHFLRLKHKPFQVEKARASLTSYEDKTLSEKALNKYRIEYQNLQRVLEISFEQEFPYAIVAWEEHTQGRGSEMLVTRAVRTHSIKSAYWRQHNLADGRLRKELGLE